MTKPNGSARDVWSMRRIAAFKGFLQYGAYPPIDTHIDVAPVDYVAKAIVHMAFRGNPLGRAFHLTNPRACHMRQALAFLRNAGYQFEELRFDELRNRLVESPDFINNALFPYQAALETMDGRRCGSSKAPELSAPRSTTSCSTRISDTSGR